MQMEMDPAMAIVDESPVEAQEEDMDVRSWCGAVGFGNEDLGFSDLPRLTGMVRDYHRRQQGAPNIHAAAAAADAAEHADAVLHTWAGQRTAGGSDGAAEGAAGIPDSMMLEGVELTVAVRSLPPLEHASGSRVITSALPASVGSASTRRKNLVEVIVA